MKKLKITVYVLLIITMFFSACNAEPAPEKANYNGTSDGYVYWYEEGRNRDWEKTVLEFANTFLTKHPKVADKETKITTDLLTDEYVFTKEYFDPALQEDFIESVNILIPKIGELEDSEIIFELSGIVALLKDAHSQVFGDYGRYYPINLEAIYTGENVEYYAVRVPVENEELVFSKLKSINGVAIEEIAAMAENYISAENSYDLNTRLEEYYSDENFLKNLKIVEKESDTAEFVFIKDDGTEVSCVFEALELEDYYAVEMTYTHLRQQDLLIYKNSLNFWYEFIDDETLYIRIQAFDASDFSSLLKTVTELNKAVTPESAVSKTIVDIRDNSGGQKVPGYNEFVEMLNKDEFGDVYALINDSCFSMAVVMPSILKQHVDDIVLVGCPTGEPPNLFGVINGVSEFSGSGVYFQMGEYAVNSWPDYEYDALMPDITIYQTIEDYKNGIDTVLEAVLAME
ncbi:MAG: hypothetical protein IJ306_05180 [Oscillospiraceae bacterium]|nr:hypothetical protein [Oscillospiraceae bacterium]